MIFSDLKPYPEMKDSGVPRLGGIPENWTSGKLRNILKKFTKRNRPDLSLLSVVREKGVILRDINNNDENHNFIPDDLSNYKVVRRGQFVMNKMKAWQGSYGISGYDGIVSPAYFIFDIDGVDESYFHSAIRSRAYIPFFTQASDGVRIGQWDLSHARMKEIPFFMPPLAEQRSIVRFLDYVDNRIHRYIRAKQKLIKLLEEQKQVIIHHSVTRGLDPNVRLKPSGVEWLGDIPEHWRMSKLKFEMRFFSGGTPSKDNLSYWTGNIPWVSPKDMKNDIINDTEDHITEEAVVTSSTRLVPSGSVLLVVRSGILQRTIPIAFCNREVALNQDIKALRTKGRISSDYFILLVHGCENTLLAEWIKQGATVESIEHQFLANTRIPIPPLTEQTSVVRFINKTTANISEAVNLVEREISLLREYRARLISDVVTGKLDVRGIDIPPTIGADEPQEYSALLDADVTMEDQVMQEEITTGLEDGE